MKVHLLRPLLILLCASNVASAAEPAYRDIYPDTWVATDGSAEPCRTMRRWAP